jgi:hypothetical protein
MVPKESRNRSGQSFIIGENNSSLTIQNIQIDLNNKAYTGSVTLDLGLGDRNLNTSNTVSVTDTTGSTGAGTIGGNLTILSGSGSEDIQIGPQGSATNMVVGGKCNSCGS